MSRYEIGSRAWKKVKWRDVCAFYESGKACAQTASTWTGLPLKEVQAYYDRRDELRDPDRVRALVQDLNRGDIYVTTGWGSSA